MRAKHYTPTYQEKQFHCIHCGVYASQSWAEMYFILGNTQNDTEITVSRCHHCSQCSFWYKDKMIVPAEASVEPAHPDLPEDCIPEYQEARDVFAKSPRASGALLRLCIQKLMPHLGVSGDNINDDIKSLVSKGLPIMVQQALDYCRVVGNNAVHPGQIDLNDTPDVAQKLFQMINFIVEDRITRPKEIQDLYNQLPENSRKAIEKRDGKKKKGNGSATSP